MKKFIIEITDNDVYINGRLICCYLPMDKEDHKVNLDKIAILGLADEMGYEATYLFDEMYRRLEEMLDEIDEEDY